MAQIFKSRDLTFSIPEKESDFAQATQRIGFTPTITTYTVYPYTKFAANVWQPTYSAYCCVAMSMPSPTCMLSGGPNWLDENEISKITSRETLKMLGEKLHNSLEEVKTRQAELLAAK